MMLVTHPERAQSFAHRDFSFLCVFLIFFYFQLKDIYNIVLASAKHLYESAMDICIHRDFSKWDNSIIP